MHIKQNPCKGSIDTKMWESFPAEIYGYTNQGNEVITNETFYFKVVFVFENHN